MGDLLPPSHVGKSPLRRPGEGRRERCAVLDVLRTNLEDHPLLLPSHQLLLSSHQLLLSSHQLLLSSHSHKAAAVTIALMVAVTIAGG